ncbi:hypothetical protein JI435_422870 [Parastagonospora nodorum SN15]|uniref:Uncharacterized protein n=1 Tax=Phaeosphaeria nodorum (strain SN15 / ATCC MYA-4574 / FGSC 10173) TaxID=321614 RepID=A0A7U2I9S0_PHANO|nr:hypothetical protein JI435_422870 [Parastagonospora nodorum SN15]
MPPSTTTPSTSPPWHLAAVFSFWSFLMPLFLLMWPPFPLTL